MNEAPERIWAWVDNLAGIVGTAHCPETPSHIPGGPNAVSRTAEYIRADLFDAVKAERDNYKALYEAERDDACQDAMEPELTRIVHMAEGAGWHRAEIVTAILALTVSDIRLHAGAEAAAEILREAIAALDD